MIATNVPKVFNAMNNNESGKCLQLEIKINKVKVHELINAELVYGVRVLHNLRTNIHMDEFERWDV